MKIRDKIIFSFLSVVCLLFVTILVKFYGIVKTYSLISPAVMEDIQKANAAAEKSEDGTAQEETLSSDPVVQAHFAQSFKKIIEQELDKIVMAPSDGSSLLLLSVCHELKGTLSNSQASVVQLPYSLDSSFASKESELIREHTGQFASQLSILQVRSADELKNNSFWKSWKKTKVSEAAFLGTLRRNALTISKLVRNKDISKSAEKVIIAFGEKRFSREAKVKELVQKAKRSAEEFSREILSTGVGAAPDVVADLNNSILAVLSATGTAGLKKEWTKLDTVLGSIPSSLPAAGVNNLIDSVLTSAQKLHKQWRSLIKARLQHYDILEKGQWVINGYKDKVASCMTLIASIESYVISDIALALKGAEGISTKLGDVVVSTCTNIPDAEFSTFDSVKALKERAESFSWRRHYNGQLGDLTFLIIIFIFGIALSIILGLAVYRDVSNPLYILKNSLNNLSMGGEKRRINLKLSSEFGSLVEAYNRYLDNLTSTEKRMVKCPDCTNPYEIGDAFCKHCGRPLRANS